MAAITLRSVKGEPLTHTEVDDNFSNLNTEVGNALTSASIGSTVQAYDADTAKYDDATANFSGALQNGGSNVVVNSDIGSTVQAYDADTAKLDAEQTFTAQQTFSETKSTVYALSGTEINPANGSIQYKTLADATTFTEALESGQSVVLKLDGGATYAVTWPSVTWVTSTGNEAPTLTANDILVLFKIDTTLYGAYVGSYT